MAFGHQMGALQATWVGKMKFGELRIPPSSPFGGQMAFVHQIWARRAPSWWPKATSPPQELEGGTHSAPNFNFTSQGGRRAPIWWPKATSPPQELEVWPP